MCKPFARLISILLICFLFAGACTPSAAAAGESTASLGQLCDSFVPNDQVFTLTGSARIYLISDSAPTGELLQTIQLIQQQFAADDLTMELVWGPADWARTGDICLSVVTNSALGTEGYQLSVTDKVAISAATPDGLIYGANALIKHIRNGGTSIQGFTAVDTPDTRQRAVSLDCGRKYYSKDWICNFIRQMSWMGYNTLELHFSDDSGFRIDLWDEDYYKGQFQPKNDFSWLCGSNYTSWTLSAYQNDPDKGKYLTTAELVEILETANAYHIEVIPAFDSPSHLDYTTWKYEQNYKSNSNYSFYSTYDNTTYYAKNVNGCINYTGAVRLSTPLQWPYYSAVNINDAQGKAFIFELYIDIANFFKEYAGSTNFSIGADEVQLSTSNLASGYSYKWGFRDFVAYINELNALLNNKGYTMRMYNDFMGSTSYNASNYSFADNIEILYWDSPFNPSAKTASNHTEPVSHYVDKGMTLYNCIQTHTYYALRITSDGSDARSAYNRQWTFYRATEENIYNEWYPANISEIGDYSEDVPDVPDANLGGAYYLIWCDYACVSTEAEIWNGVYDKTTQNTGEFYSLLDRMWSNTVKMWNWDINQTVSYADYAALRAKFGYFPGYSSCSAPARLPEAVTPTKAYRADHSALKAAITLKLPSEDYTSKSYISYNLAYEKALEVDANNASTEEEIAEAIYALHMAKNQLVLKTAVLTVHCKTTVNGSERLIKTLYYPLVVNDYRFHIPSMTGYIYTSCDGGNFTPLTTQDGSGFVTGRSNGSDVVTIWYQNTPDTTSLNYMIRNAVPEKGDYTDSSWSAYQSALNNALKFSVNNNVTQADIDRVMSDLEAAQTGLAIDCTHTEIYSIERLSHVARLNKQVALRIITTPDVTTIDVTSPGGKESLTRCVGKIQTMTNSETVKIWLIYFPADEVGNFTYTITAGTATQTVDITVQ